MFRRERERVNSKSKVRPVAAFNATSISCRRSQLSDQAGPQSYPMASHPIMSCHGKMQNAEAPASATTQAKVRGIPNAHCGAEEGGRGMGRR